MRRHGDEHRDGERDRNRRPRPIDRRSGRCGRSSDCRGSDPTPPPESEVLELVADATLAYERTGWAPSVSMRDGLSRVLDYVRANPTLYDIDRYVT